jgi:hypothetical protein
MNKSRNNLQSKIEANSYLFYLGVAFSYSILGCTNSDVIKGNSKKDQSSQPPSASALQSDEDDTEDERIDEPQMIAGAFLTCSRMPQTEVTAQDPEDTEPVGCAIRAADRKQFNTWDQQKIQIVSKHKSAGGTKPIPSRRGAKGSRWNVIAFLPSVQLYTGELVVEVSLNNNPPLLALPFALSNLQASTMKEIEEVKKETSAEQNAGQIPASPNPGEPPPKGPEFFSLGKEDIRPSHVLRLDKPDGVIRFFYPSKFCESNGTIRSDVDGQPIKTPEPTMSQPGCFGSFSNKEDISIGKRQVVSASNCMFIQDSYNIYIFDSLRVQSDPNKYSVNSLSNLVITKPICGGF